MEGKSLILFDGVCNFCNRSVNFLIRRDKGGHFRFAPLQSITGRELLQQYGLTAPAPDSFVLIENGRAFVRSTAVLRVMKKLPGGWKLLYGLVICPRFLRDAAYTWFARHRYTWFGRRDTCMVPTPEIREKFI